MGIDFCTVEDAFFSFVEHGCTRYTAREIRMVWESLLLEY
jgi:hypothetical protein